MVYALELHDLRKSSGDCCIVYSCNTVNILIIEDHLTRPVLRVAASLGSSGIGQGMLK